MGQEHGFLFTKMDLSIELLNDQCLESEINDELRREKGHSAYRLPLDLRLQHELFSGSPALHLCMYACMYVLVLSS